MRLTYVINRYPAVSATFIRDEIAALRARGHQIDVISVRRSEAHDAITDPSRAEQAGVSWLVPVAALDLVRAHLAALMASPAGYAATIRHALALRPGGMKGAVWQLLYFALAIRVWRRARAAESTHLHSHFTFAGSDIALLAAEFGRHAGSGPQTFSLTIHGSDEFYVVDQTRIAAKVADSAGIVAISDFTRSQILRLLAPGEWPKVRVVHCGIDTDFFSPGQAPVAPQDGRARILTVGRLVPPKGYAILIEAVARLVERGHAVELTLVGGGPGGDALRAQAAGAGLEGRVHFPGPVGGEPLRDLIAGSTVFAISSFAEGIPIVLMEALALGVPVVSTGIMGIPELVEDGVSGRLVPPASIDRLADALEEVLGDVELRRRFGRAGRERVVEQFDIRSSAVALERFFADVGGG